MRGRQPALGDGVRAERREGRRLVVADAVADDDLLALGAALAGHRLVTGGSGIALGLPENFRARRHALPDSADAAGRREGPGGGAVRLLLDRLAAAGRGLSRNRIPASRSIRPQLMDGVDDRRHGRRLGRRPERRAPIVYSTADPAAVAGAQQNFGRDEIAATIEHFFADLVRRLADGGVRRIVVGGGETSGAVVEALGVTSLAHRRARSIPACRRWSPSATARSAWR